MGKLPVLVVDDDEAIASTVARFLNAKGYDATVVNDGEEALERLRTGAFPVVVSDIYIDRVTGLDVLREAKAAAPEAAVILMTARGSVRTTVEAEMAGAFEYLAKPFDLADLLRVVERAESALAGPVPRDMPDAEEFGNIVGFSPAMVDVYKKIARAARSDETVLITGETGVGKELVARAVHEHSTRASKPFAPVDCGAIPAALWESELFGSVRGAFTGAERDRAGVVETARGGTVFLDEAGEIPLEFQSKLLRFLQEKEYRPVGSAVTKAAEVRIIAATNRQLERMVRDGQFRADLFYRLDVLRIDVPSLRERRADIAHLAARFLNEAAASSGKKVWLGEGVLEYLENQEWPGNVRQLENLIARLVAMMPEGPVSVDDVRRALEREEPERGEEPVALDDVEKRQILRVLAQTGGNKTKAAEILGIQRRTLYKKLERIEREQRRAGPEREDA